MQHLGYVDFVYLWYCLLLTLSLFLYIILFRNFRVVLIKIILK